MNKWTKQIEQQYSKQQGEVNKWLRSNPFKEIQREMTYKEAAQEISKFLFSKYGNDDLCDKMKLERFLDLDAAGGVSNRFIVTRHYIPQTIRQTMDEQ